MSDANGLFQRERHQIMNPKEVINSMPIRGTARLKIAFLETLSEHGPSYRLDNDTISRPKAPICA
jgi:hypothetical protein